RIANERSDHLTQCQIMTERRTQRQFPGNREKVQGNLWMAAASEVACCQTQTGLLWTRRSARRSAQVGYSFRANAGTIHFVFKPEQRRPRVVPGHSGSRRAAAHDLVR